MTTVVNIILAACGLAVGVAAIGGETWRKRGVSWRHCVTTRGWIAIGALLLAFMAGLVRELLPSEAEQALAKVLREHTLQLVKESDEPEIATARLREAVRKSGFPDVAEELYCPVYRARGEVNVREKANRKAPVRGQVEPGTLLRLLDAKTGWILIRTDENLQGWVEMGQVEPAP